MISLSPDPAVLTNLMLTFADSNEGPLLTNIHRQSNEFGYSSGKLEDRICFELVFLGFI